VEKIPHPSGGKDKAWLLIPVQIPGEPVRVNFSLPGAAPEALDRAGTELRLSRSGATAYLAPEREATTSRQARPTRKRA
jgi:hypothetical protein